MDLKDYTNLYHLSKTLRFRLIPVGETSKNIERYIKQDETRNDEVKILKQIIARFDKKFIEESLEGFKLDKLEELANKIVKNPKDDTSQKEINNLKKDLRQQIYNQFEKSAVKIGKKLKDITAGEIVKIIKETTFEINLTDEEQQIINNFQGFSTYISDYAKNRENIYSAEEIPSAVAYRMINENFVRFIHNISAISDALSVFNEDEKNKLQNNFEDSLGGLSKLSEVNTYNELLLQKGIDNYNHVIGGYTLESGEKIQGLNELINLYNQKNKKHKLKLVKTLDKQILGDSESISFVLEAYESDNEVLNEISDFYTKKLNNQVTVIKQVFNNLEKYDKNKIYIKNGSSIASLSNTALGVWNLLDSLISEKYDFENGYKETKTYAENKKRYLKNIAGYSIEYLQDLVDTTELDVQKNDLVKSISKEISDSCLTIKKDYELIKKLLDGEVELSKKLSHDEENITKIKSFLDSWKDLQRKLNCFYDGEEVEIDNEFINSINGYKALGRSINSIYNKTRNYLTKKPFSRDKIKISFNTPTLLDGWDVNKEEDNLGVLLYKEEKYYLGIIDSRDKKIFGDAPECTSNNYFEKVIYKQIPNAARYFSSKQINPTSPPENIKRYLSSGFDKKK